MSTKENHMTTTSKPRHAAERALPIYAATRAQHALRQHSGPIDGDALAAARKKGGARVDPDLWALVAEPEAPTEPIAGLPPAAPEDEKRGALAAVLSRWRWRTTLAKLAIAEPRVEAPTSKGGGTE